VFAINSHKWISNISTVYSLHAYNFPQATKHRLARPQKGKNKKDREATSASRLRASHSNYFKVMTDVWSW